MNKFLLNIWLFFVILNYCLCATWISDIAKHKDHPDKCYDEITNHLFSFGEIYKPIGRCAVLRCTGPGQISGHSCGKVLLPQCKSIGFDLTKPHPYCCESFQCTDKNGNQFIHTPGVPRIIENNSDLSKNIDNNL